MRGPSRRLKGPAAAAPPARDCGDAIGLALASVSLAILALAIWHGRSEGTPAADPYAGQDDDMVVVAYKLDPEEWSGARPSLCQIVHHYRLGDSAAAATLHLNRRSGDCASPNQPVAPGETVRLAVWASPLYRHCGVLAARCRSRPASGADAGSRQHP